MPDYVVTKVADVLNLHKKSLNGSKVLVLGVAYKNDVDDTRESPALDVINRLEEKGAKVDYADPLVDTISFDGKKMKSVKISGPALKKYDCAVIVTDHAVFNYRQIVKNSKAIVDTRNALKKFKAPNIHKI
jgi:UDP-N-acetyl-D-glucosamine dehydrogenase